MLSLQQTFDNIQKNIDAIQDEEARKAAQEKFEMMPKDPSLWVLKSFSGLLDNSKVAVSASEEEIKKQYFAAACKEMEKYYTDKKDIEGMASRSLGGFEFDLFYSCTLEEESQDARGKQSYKTYMAASNSETNFFDVSRSVRNDNAVMQINKSGFLGKKYEFVRSAGTSLKQEQFAFIHNNKNDSGVIQRYYHIRGFSKDNWDENIEEKRDDQDVSVHAIFEKGKIIFCKINHDVNKSGKQADRTTELDIANGMIMKNTRVNSSNFEIDNVAEEHLREPNSVYNLIKNIVHEQSRELDDYNEYDL